MNWITNWSFVASCQARLSSVIRRYPGIGIPGLTPGFIPPGVRVFLQSENGILGQGPYPTAEQVRDPIFHAGTGQGPYIQHPNRAGAIYPTPEQVRGPISHSGTGQGGPISHTRTGQGPYIPQRNRSGALYPTPEQVRGPISQTGIGQGPYIHRWALITLNVSIRCFYRWYFRNEPVR